MSLHTCPICLIVVFSDEAGVVGPLKAQRAGYQYVHADCLTTPCDAVIMGMACTKTENHEGPHEHDDVTWYAPRPPVPHPVPLKPRAKSAAAVKVFGP